MSALRNITLVAACAAAAASVASAQGVKPVPRPQVGNELVGRAVLPAETFTPGPTSGTLIGTGAVNGVPVPFVGKQPVQGFSAVLSNGDGTFWVMADNGYGSLQNSSDFNLRMYRVRPDFELGYALPSGAGSGTISILDWIELSDPDGRIPFAIVNQFSDERVLTGADFDLESVRRAPDGSLWFGDEFGPFLIHTDASGKVLEAPFRLPDPDNAGAEVRAPQNPYNEEISALRIMNALGAHARAFGGRSPVFSPANTLCDDKVAATNVPNRVAPPAGSGLKPASSEIFPTQLIQAAGFPVVIYTVNDKPTMNVLLKLGVNGIISDSSDLLYEAVRDYDANGDGTAGDYLLPNGLIDPAKFDAQGHRGSRNLRPENTLPAMEAGLDNLVTTLETDNGITRDGVPVLSHDPTLQTAKCRRADGQPYTNAVLIKDYTLAEIQSTFICDKLLPGRPQTNDPAASPVTAAFAAAARITHPYAVPSTQQLFDFVKFYEAYYSSGAGASVPGAALRAANAARVRFNIETKVNPRAEYVARTVGPQDFARAVANVIVANTLTDRADIQSFDFRTLLVAQEEYPSIRTVALFGDFPKFADPTISGSDESTNLQDENGANTPWLAGMYWPYRETALDRPFRARTSGGFEGMAIDASRRHLYPLLELPLVGADPKTLLISQFDIAAKRYTGKTFLYKLDARGTNIGDFTMYSDTEGLIIERDGTQGNLQGFKKIYRIRLGEPGSYVEKAEAVDLMNISDPRTISLPGEPGDVGLGTTFAFPFVTIEDVVVLAPDLLGVLNDNNFPFSIGRHQGTKRPDDNEFILIRLEQPLW